MTRSALSLLELTVTVTGHAPAEEVLPLIHALRRAWDEVAELRVELARARGEPVEIGYVHVGPLPDGSLPF